MKGRVIVSDNKFPMALTPGTVLSGQYVIEKVLGQGGFGITYKAIDHKNNNRPVAVKEYFPDSMVYRSAATVISHPGERTEFFEYGKQSFLAEAETLAKFIGNKNIVRVYSYFEENGTAYFAMEYVDGIPFDKYLLGKGGRIGIDEAKSILIPVMDALGAVHSAGIVHRDVTPDNIYISSDGRIMLLDFGAARYSLGDKSRSLDVVLKHGFAPKEQYARRGKQGPFTDVYALGATFYFALTGRRPPDSIERLEEDDLVPPTTLGVKLTPYQEEAILKALSVSPSDRYQSMAEFKSVMLNEPINNNAYAANISQTVSPMTGQQFSTGQQFPNAQQMPTSQQFQNVQQMPTSQQLQTGQQFQNVQQMPTSQQFQTGQQFQNVQQMPASQQFGNAQQMPTSQQYPNMQQGLGQTLNQTVAANTGSYAQNITPAVNTPGNPLSLAKNNTPQAAPVAMPQQPMNVGMQQPVYNTPAKPRKKGLIIGIGAACLAVCIIVGVVIGVASSGKKGSKNNGGGYDDYTSVPVASGSDDTNSTSPKIFDVSVTSKPATTTSSTTTKTTHSLSDLEIVGNSVGNLKNTAIYAADGDRKFWTDDDGHSLMSNISGKNYFYEDESGLFSCLSYYDGVLYYLYDHQAYSIDVDTESKGTKIPELKAYANIERLYISPAYYFVFQDKKVYRISTETGETEDSIGVDYSDDFTFYNGWMYFIADDDDGHSSVLYVKEDDFNTFSEYYYYDNSGYYSSPVIADGILYYFWIDGEKISLMKRDPDFTEDDDSIQFDISSYVSSGTKKPIVFDLNVIGSNVFYTLSYSGEDDMTIQHLILDKNKVSLDDAVTNVDAFNPCLTVDSDGNYKLNYYGYNSDKDTYTNYFAVYDRTTNKKKSN